MSKKIEIKGGLRNDPLSFNVIKSKGNHEYYQGNKRVYDHELQRVTSKYRLSIDEIDHAIESLTQTLPNVHFIQRTSFIHDRVRFLGCTLWIHADPQLAYKMNDFDHIADFTPDKCDEFNDRDIKWLNSQLDLPNDGTYDSTVVMSHHLPSYQLIAEKYHGNPMNGFYANNLDSLVMKANIWVCGHTHYAKHVMIGNCRCYVNPTGYAGEVSNYDPNAIIEI